MRGWKPKEFFGGTIVWPFSLAVEIALILLPSKQERDEEIFATNFVA